MFYYQIKHSFFFSEILIYLETMNNIAYFSIILAINIALSLSLYSDSNRFYLYKFNNSMAFKFDLNFENMYLLESFYQTSEQKLDLMRCIALSSKNNLTKAISYEVNADLTVSCKSYSPLNFLSVDIFVPAPLQSRIYLITQIKIIKCK